MLKKKKSIIERILKHLKQGTLWSSRSPQSNFTWNNEFEAALVAWLQYLTKVGALHSDNQVIN